MLQVKERLFLEQHMRLATEPAKGLLISARELADTRQCRSHLQTWQRSMGYPDLVVTASQFSKRYAFLSLLPVLTAMTLFDKGLDGELHNCRLLSVEQEGNWLPRLSLIDGGAVSPITAGRVNWRNTILQRVFAGHVAHVWQATSKATGVKASILWENTATYVFWLYEHKLPNVTGINLDQVQEDYAYLIHGTIPDVFGEKFHPLRRFFKRTGERQRVRSTCCLHYRTAHGAARCVACPLHGSIRQKSVSN